VETRIANLRAVQRALLRWHDAHALQAPWRASGDPYASLVAAVMAQQTQMSRVLPSYERFVAAFPTLEALARASSGDVIRAWAGMGYNQRAVRLHRAARQIASSGWPRTAAELARIDGIGPFTAAVVASFAFGEAAACIDTNVRRVLGRIAGDETIDGAALRGLAHASIAREAPAQWNQALMDYGAVVCTSRPKCDACVVRRWCASSERYADGGAKRVGEEREAYRAARRVKREPPFEGSTRFFRGRIIDALRAAPPGKGVRIDALPSLIANDHTLPSPDELRAMLDALMAQGLAVVCGDIVSLPE
jgi:A/G-specific adenine glycosylase